MKKWISLALIFFIGCTTTTIPIYLPDKKPYVKRFYADYDTTLSAVQQTLSELGWKIQQTTDPAEYEAMRTSDLDEKQVLLITEIRQMPLFVATRYARMNVYLRSKKNISEIEIRYLTLSSTTFKRVNDYSNDSEVNRIFGKLEEVLQSSQSN